MTIKIYDTDAHQNEFESVVTACRFDEARGLFKTQLEKTAFFPAGGGQAGDRGVILPKDAPTSCVVQDVTEEDGLIWHWTEQSFEEGSIVCGSIDYEARFDRMQQHTAEHIASGIADRLFGACNVGFHLGEEVTTFDFDLPLERHQIERVETLTNEAIFKDEPVRVFYPTEEELRSLSYRSKKELAGDVRIVAIESEDAKVDVCACCAPHVMRTGEIGMMKIIKQESYKGGVRLTMVAGKRCYRFLSQRFDEMMRLSEMLSTSVEKVENSFAAMRKETEQLKATIAKQNDELLEASLPALKALAKTKPSVCVICRTDDKARRKLIGALSPFFEGQVAVLFPKEESDPKATQYSFVIGSETKDLLPLMTLLKEHFGAKGGGSSRMIQGSLTAEEEEILKFLEVN